jgi:hypothetical protein
MSSNTILLMELVDDFLIHYHTIKKYTTQHIQFPFLYLNKNNTV